MGVVGTLVAMFIDGWGFGDWVGVLDDGRVSD